jgi:hypothetical protein
MGVRGDGGGVGLVVWGETCELNLGGGGVAQPLSPECQEAMQQRGGVTACSASTCLQISTNAGLRVHLRHISFLQLPCSRCCCVF